MARSSVQPPQTPVETAETGPRTVWRFGFNDFIEELPADKLKDFKPTGTFAVDFSALSAKCEVMLHPGFVPPVRKQASSPTAESESQNPGSLLTLTNILVGRASMLVFRQVIPTALHVEVLRITGCCLDAESLALLRAGLTESCSVAVLQLDWNPVEMKHSDQDAVALKAAFDSGDLQTIDALEKNREQQQAERMLRAFGELLSSRYGDVPSAMKALQKAAIRDSHHEATAGVEPFPPSVWEDVFHNVLNIGAQETEKIFSLADGPLYGAGDGYATFDSLEKILQNVQPLSAEEEAADPVGKAFGAFVDGTSPLDVVSFRHCGLGRLECVAIGKALGQSKNIRALNLWGNKICDHGAAALAESFEVYYGLQFLGLGRNLVTHVGLTKLCEPLGFARIDDKAQADQIQKDMKERAKERDKRTGKNAPVPKKDVYGNDRYLPEFFVPTCDQATDDNGEYWLWGRNRTLKTLNLEHNPIVDASVVMQLQPWGVGDLHLKGVPCAEELAKLYAEVRGTGAAEAAEEDPAQAVPEEEEAGQETKGWRLLFR